MNRIQLKETYSNSTVPDKGVQHMLNVTENNLGCLKITIKLHIIHLFPEMFINKMLLQIMFQTYSIL
jgi:hypothetical protein